MVVVIVTTSGQNQEVPHPPMPETVFTHVTLEHLRDLQRDLAELGYPRAMTDACLGWLIRLAAGDESVTSPQTLSEYRKMLRAVLTWRGVVWPPKKPRTGGSAAAAGARQELVNGDQSCAWCELETTTAHNPGAVKPAAAAA